MSTKRPNIVKATFPDCPPNVAACRVGDLMAGVAFCLNNEATPLVVSNATSPPGTVYAIDLACPGFMVPLPSDEEVIPLEPGNYLRVVWKVVGPGEE
jgi:hypothetical protein